MVARRDIIDATETELQRDVVCACTHDRDFAVLLTETTSDDFTDPVSRTVRDVVVGMLAVHLDPDLITIRKRLVELGHEDMMSRWLSHYAASNAVTASVREVRGWVAEIRISTLRRKIIRGAEMAIALARSCADADRLHREIPELFAEALGAYQRKEAISEAEALRLAGENFEREQTCPTGLFTGFDPLDESFPRGIRPGEIVVMAADSSMGKSAAALQLARGVARTSSVYFWSGEMGSDELAERIVCQSQECSVRAIVETPSRFWTEAENSANLWIDDESDLDVQQLVTRLQIFKLQRKNFTLAVIDYLGLLCDNDYKEISKASKLLKRTARRLGICIWLVHQLNRDVSRRQDKEPQTSDIRDSGQIVQDADKILMFYRPGFYDETKPQDEAWMLIRKFRNGKRNMKIRCRYIGEQYRWEPYPDRKPDWSDLGRRPAYLEKLPPNEYSPPALSEIEMEDIPI